MMKKYFLFITLICFIYNISCEEEAKSEDDTPAVRMPKNFTDLFDYDQNYPQESCLELIDSDHFERIKPKFIEAAMSRAWWQCAEAIIGETTETSQILSINNEFHLQKKNILKKMDELEKVMIAAKSGGKPIKPAFQWAQSPDKVFINIKFSHKLDAPATLGTKVENLEMTNDTLHVLGVKDHKKFELDLQFYGEIIPEESEWKEDSVGKVTVTLKKAGGESAWRYLLKDGVNLRQMHLWIDMHDQYKMDLEPLKKDWSDDEVSKKEKRKERAAEVAAEAEKEAKAKAEADAKKREELGLQADEKIEDPDEELLWGHVVLPDEENDPAELTSVIREIESKTIKEIRRLENEKARKEREVDLKIRDLHLSKPGLHDVLHYARRNLRALRDDQILKMRRKFYYPDGPPEAGEAAEAARIEAEKRAKEGAAAEKSFLEEYAKRAAKAQEEATKLEKAKMGDKVDGLLKEEL